MVSTPSLIASMSLPAMWGMYVFLFYWYDRSQYSRGVVDYLALWRQPLSDSCVSASFSQISRSSIAFIPAKFRWTSGIFGSNSKLLADKFFSMSVSINSRLKFLFFLALSFLWNLLRSIIVTTRTSELDLPFMLHWIAICIHSGFGCWLGGFEYQSQAYILWSMCNVQCLSDLFQGSVCIFT